MLMKILHLSLNSQQYSKIRYSEIINSEDFKILKSFKVTRVFWKDSGIEKVLKVPKFKKF